MIIIAIITIKVDFQSLWKSRQTLSFETWKTKNSGPILLTCFGRGLNSPIFCIVFRYILCGVHACVYEFMHTCRHMYTCAYGDPNLMSSVFLHTSHSVCWGTAPCWTQSSLTLTSPASLAHLPQGCYVSASCITDKLQPSHSHGKYFIHWATHNATFPF